MKEKKRIEQTSVETEDVSGSGIVSGNNNVTNVTNITNITVLPKEEQPKTATPIQMPTGLKPVSKMCNRNKQVNDFIRYFQDNCRKYPGKPQMYLIHGDAGECHDSFIERIRYKELRLLWERDIYYSEDRIPEWPESRDFELRRHDLICNLTSKFDGKVSADISTAEFSRLPCFDKRSLVMIRHNMDAFRWDKRNETKLIAWYREYWSKLECNEKTPLFLIFLNIEYPKDSKVPLKQKVCFWSYCSPKTIESKLLEIVAIQNENCPCSLLSKLEPVEESHVRHWLKEHAKILEHKWESIISEIFSEQTREVSMNAVEAILFKTLIEQDKTVWK